MQSLLSAAIADHAKLVQSLATLGPQLQRLGDAMVSAWSKGGKVLTCGNGGSAADAMHLAEELVARFMKNRKALAAIALCDPTVLTCAANDFGYDAVFSRQVEAIGNAGDVLIVFTTSGNSPSILRAIEAAKAKGLTTASFLGKDGGKARGTCDIELHVQHPLPHRVQEMHGVLYHTLCEWVDAHVG